MILGKIELIKMSVISAGLTPITISLNQTGLDSVMDEISSFTNGLISSMRCPLLLGLKVSIDLSQEHEFIIGVV